MIRRGVSRVAVPCGTGKLPLPWLGGGGTPLGQSDRVFKSLDEMLRRAPARRVFPVGRSGIEPGCPCTPLRQSSVSPVVSKGPTKLWPETLRCSAIELQRCAMRVALVGFEPPTPGFQSMYSEPAVGLLRGAGGSRTRFKPLCGRSPCRLAPAPSCQCPRQELNLVFDLRTVAC